MHSHMWSQLTLLFSGCGSILLPYSQNSPIRCNSVVSSATHRAASQIPQGSPFNHASPPISWPVSGCPIALATALTETLLGAFAITANPQTTALPDKLLGGFGLTDPAEERV
ncbi:hypothetical protein [Leptodesmis sichuanensis]|uniref:hypothetical protein n=1 Tax=Leptodesmis sichuanensis TaxID=2906798 RepID=UPI001F36780E|nr:hypothetical protein [Leptodesmis sichuanensis]UIE40223.1 hypothetical protein KIK02_12200 [Leptodesmis sichuanensis A121]